MLEANWLAVAMYFMNADRLNFVFISLSMADWTNMSLTRDMSYSVTRGCEYEWWLERRWRRTQRQQRWLGGRLHNYLQEDNRRENFERSQHHSQKNHGFRSRGVTYSLLFLFNSYVIILKAAQGTQNWCINGNNSKQPSMCSGMID